MLACTVKAPHSALGDGVFKANLTQLTKEYKQGLGISQKLIAAIEAGNLKKL